MPDPSDAPPFIYQLAWSGVAVVFAYYAAMSIVFRWNSHRNIGVTKYEPPERISPGVAAYLIEGGRSERAFAAALISLAIKGYLEIQQEKDWVLLEKLKEPNGTLPPEEAGILASLFSPGRAPTYKFSGRDFGRVWYAYKEFDELLKETAHPELLSAHAGVWWWGIAASYVIMAVAVSGLPIFEKGTQWASIAYLSVWIVVGCSCLVAALRVWPVTIRKLGSFLPGNSRPRRPLDMNDAIPFILIGPMFLGFSFLAYLSSLKFVVLVVTLIVMTSVFQHLLEAPTDAGRKVIAELNNFREFLACADADRDNRENERGHTPAVLEKYSAYAVALDVEHAWGEEFAENLLELLQLNQSYSRHWPRRPLADHDRGIIELKIGHRK
jgi:hypothetical protein